MSNTDLRGASLKGVTLAGVNLEGARVDSQTDLSAVTWSGTTCPDGRNSDDVGGTCASHLRAKQEE